jgi:hypothetical protein
MSVESMIEPFDAARFATQLETALQGWRFSFGAEGRMVRRCQEFASVLGDCSGTTVQERWDDFEDRIWPAWVDGHERVGGGLWRWGTWAAVLTRSVRPGWAFMRTGRVGQWLEHLPADDSLVEQADVLAAAVEALGWVSSPAREVTVALGIRVLLVAGHHRLDEITEDDLLQVPLRTKGQEALDAALCGLGILTRTPKRGITRRRRTGPLSPAEMVEHSEIPERFRAVTVLYLQTYASRISDVYTTVRHKQGAIAHFWGYIDKHHPEVASCAELTPAHARGFVDYAIERARLVRRRPAEVEGDRTTAHSWLTDVRCFSLTSALGPPNPDHRSPVTHRRWSPSHVTTSLELGRAGSAANSRPDGLHGHRPRARDAEHPRLRAATLARG